MRLARPFATAAVRAGGLAVLLALLTSACASEPKAKPDAPNAGGVDLPPGVAPAGAEAGAGEARPDNGVSACLIAREELAGQPAVVEGRLVTAEAKRGPAPLVLRLARPRCVVGLPHTRYVTDVWIASAGADLRPLVDSHVRLSGDIIAGTTDSGEAAIVLLVHDVARAESGSPRSLEDP